MAQQKEKVAVLGGGLGGCVAAAALTDPKQNQKYDVTLYTMGWRLGGKGASGRNPARGERIEEHGLHIWFGCYDNAFKLMRELYEELDRPATAPLATLEEAFHKQSVFVLQEKVGDEWVPWELEFPEFDIDPGGHPSTWAFVQIILAWAYRALKWAFGGSFTTEHPLQIKHEGFLNKLGDAVENGFAEVGSLFHHERDQLLADFLHPHHDDDAHHAAGERALESGVTPVHMMEAIHASIHGKSHKEMKAGWGAKALARSIKFACKAAWWDLGSKIPEDQNARRGWMLFYLGATISRGILLDDLEENGVYSINGVEGRDWLRKHAALPDDAKGDPNTLAFDSPPIRAIYDAAFAFRDGNNDTPDFSAATLLRGCLWLPFSYKGAFCYEMQAGMGDTVFTPFYEALKARGVKFKFFSQVTDIAADAAWDKVGTVTIQEQVKLGDADYQPLMDVKGLPCWPSKPFYDQIEDGEALKAAGVNLEHYDSGWTNTGETFTLNAGDDFDHLVMAIPLPAHGEVCKSLADSRPKWKDAMENVLATRTCAVQLWFERT
ncbi:MAG: NAD(P)-binding protein, partial [Pseudomonadota bacterium]